MCGEDISEAFFVAVVVVVIVVRLLLRDGRDAAATAVSLTWTPRVTQTTTFEMLGKHSCLERLFEIVGQP